MKNLTPEVIRNSNAEWGNSSFEDVYSDEDEYKIKKDLENLGTHIDGQKDHCFKRFNGRKIRRPANARAAGS